MSRSPTPSSTRSSSRSPSPGPEPAAAKRKRSASPTPRDRSASPPTRKSRRSPSDSRSPPPRRDRPNSPSPPARTPTARPNGSAAASAPVVGAVAATSGGSGGADAAAKAEFAKLLGSRTGGAYIPPARLRALQAEAAKDKTSAEYQRLSWDALRKSLNGLINKVNTSNIKHVIPELFGENLIRGKGLFARSVMRAQASSLPFTPIFAALVAIINTKLPQVGELVLVRLISQFRRAYRRNDKPVCNATSAFIAHLVNQYVAHELVALQMLLLCLEHPTDDSIEVAVGFMREVGLFLAEHSPKANNTIFERFRAVLHEGAISKRCQYMIEVLFQVRKDKYKDNPVIPEGLDLVEEEEQITHRITLDDELQVQEGLNLFKVDPKYLENEERYESIKKEILGDSEDEGSGESGSEADSEEEEDEENAAAPEKAGITDMTETNLINLRRTIYLTIMNSLNFEEAVHKLLKINLPEGREIEMCNMIVECCSQERTYSNFYGLIGERLCKLNRVWTESFQEAFDKYYETIHRYETNKLRNIGRFFGHLLASDGISWAVLHVVHMNEDETTSSSRIFIKILMQEMVEEMGNTKVVERFRTPDLRQAFAGIFPMDDPKNTRFAINYFTSIGMGRVTEDMRTFLQDAPRLMAAQHAAQLAKGGNGAGHSSEEDSSSDESSELTSSSEESDLTSSDSEEEYRWRKRAGGGGGGGGRDRDRRSPVKRERRRYSSDSRSPPRSAPPRGSGPNDTSGGRRPSPPRRRRYSSSSSRSPSPPPRSRVIGGNGGRRRSPSPSPPPPRRQRRDSSTPPRRDGPSGDRRRSSPPPPRERERDGGNGREIQRDREREQGRRQRYGDDKSSPYRRRASPEPSRRR